MSGDLLGPSISFWRWLEQQRRRDDGVGDLARDALSDADWPRRIGVKRMHEHLLERHACEGAHDSLDRAWREWGGATQAAWRPAAADDSEESR